jgi:hypothetical protein
MRVPILFLILLLPMIADSGVYKWIGPDGQVQYSDRPAEGAERIAITGGARTNDNVPRHEKDTVTELGPYTAFEILSPENNATIRDADGNVPVGILIEPSLVTGHRLRIEIDGQPVPGGVAGAQILLRGVGVGTHSIRASVIDELEVPVANTPAVVFHLRKPLPESALP